MKKDELNEALSCIQSELRNVDRVDDASREILRKLDDDIRRILGQAGEVPLEHHRSLRETLEESVDHFEASHPALTALMNRLVNALSDMGI